MTRQPYRDHLQGRETRKQTHHVLTAAARAKGWARANQRQRREAAEVYADLAEDMGHWRAERLSLRRIAARLNAAGQTTRTGTLWTATQVSRVLRRAGV